MDDWLGNEYLPFAKARATVRGLGLKSLGEWRDYCKSGKKPRDIPATPQLTYANDGWAGSGDWLGTGRVAPGNFRSFKQARKFVRRLGLKSSTAWFDYCGSGKKPGDIPTNPQITYSEAGWAGYGDWLGTGRVAPGNFRSFKDARTYAQGLGLNSKTQWIAYCALGKKPADIPKAPQMAYANDGWAGYGDWLGTNSVATHLRKYRPFKDARAYVHTLGLKSEAAWRAYCKWGEKPDDIPAHADRTYAKDGWAGMSDWLGYVRSGRRSEARSKKGTGEPAPPEASPL
jgi:hypothetical protein